MIEQHKILNRVAELVDDGKIITTSNKVYSWGWNKEGQCASDTEQHRIKYPHLMCLPLQHSKIKYI